MPKLDSMKKERSSIHNIRSKGGNTIQAWRDPIPGQEIEGIGEVSSFTVMGSTKHEVLVPLTKIHSGFVPCNPLPNRPDIDPVVDTSFGTYSSGHNTPPL